MPSTDDRPYLYIVPTTATSVLEIIPDPIGHYPWPWDFVSPGGWDTALVLRAYVHVSIQNPVSSARIGIPDTPSTY